MVPNPPHPRKPASRKPTTITPSSKSAPAKQPKKKFVPKTHTTAGVAIGKSNNKKRKDPKKQREALLARLEKELPKLNMITPAGVVKPKGRKKGKVFVEDREKMMGILNRVSDGVEGRERSKLERARHLEAIREEKRKEEEKREAERSSRMEGAKDAVRKKRKRKSAGAAPEAPKGSLEKTPKGRKKMVTFA
ncbi:hypothetical protein HOY80DRAFT_1044908 [Tuber brumale]|nr:hypothetical protein HOY80DRAFT_1044908 [Tuber brumale]